MQHILKLGITSALLLQGCAMKHIQSQRRAITPASATPTAPIIANAQTGEFWTGCVQTASMEKDGFQHFLCSDKKGRRWELLVREEPK